MGELVHKLAKTGDLGIFCFTSDSFVKPNAIVVQAVNLLTDDIIVTASAYTVADALIILSNKLKGGE